MKKIIENFPHKIGIHCATACVRDLLEYNGLDYSEELCLGLGCGINFLYTKNPAENYYYILGRNDHIEANVCKYLGIQLGTWRFTTAEKAWTWAKNHIDDDIPLIVNVEATKLEYLRERFNLLPNVRYGGHRIIVYGYDLEQDKVHLHDYVWLKPLTISINELKIARESDSREFLRNIMYSFIFPTKTIPLKQALRNAIIANVHHMLYPWIGHSGIRGMKRFAREITGWPKHVSEEDLKKNCYMAHMMLEAGGTGGGNFRRMYSRFLFQAEEILEEKNYEVAAKKYVWLAKRWTEIAKLILKGAEGIGNGIFIERNEVQPLLNELVDKEKEAIVYLGEITGYNA